MAEVFDATACHLGEGPLWHPEREELFWFDILGQRLWARGAGAARSWSFDLCYSAAGWVDRDTLLLASEVGLHRFDIPTGAQELVVPLEADNPITRSNDGRADPFGGFWIGTMGKAVEAQAGAIYRFYRGELRQLFTGLTVTNAICFAPDRACAYFTDTDTSVVHRVALDDDGWPSGAPEVWLDLTRDGLRPDGAVTDRHGNFYNAQWGAARVAVYDADGRFLRAHDLPAQRTTCPAWAGPDFRDLLVTSATVEDDNADAGKTFRIPDAGPGQAEPRVIL